MILEEKFREGNETEDEDRELVEYDKLLAVSVTV